MFRELDCSVKRYLNILVVKPRFLLILLLIPLLYYGYALLSPVSYEVSNTIVLPKGVSLELPGERGHYLSRELFLRDPDLFLLNSSLIAELNHLITRGWEIEEDGSSELAGNVMRDLDVEMVGEELLTVKYRGKQLSAGKLMVYFFSRKLITHSFRESEDGQQPTTVGSVAGNIDSFSRELEIRKNYSLWDQRRLRPLVVVSIFAFLFMLVFMGVADWLDSSLKTESQASRFLDLPVLGSLPNIKELGVSLGRKSDPPEKEF